VTSQCYFTLACLGKSTLLSTFRYLILDRQCLTALQHQELVVVAHEAGSSSIVRIPDVTNTSRLEKLLELDGVERIEDINVFSNYLVSHERTAENTPRLRVVPLIQKGESRDPPVLEHVVTLPDQVGTLQLDSNLVSRSNANAP
jgi:protease II